LTPESPKLWLVGFSLPISQTMDEGNRLCEKESKYLGLK